MERPGAWGCAAGDSSGHRILDSRARRYSLMRPGPHPRVILALGGRVSEVLEYSDDPKAVVWGALKGISGNSVGEG